MSDLNIIARPTPQQLSDAFDAVNRINHISHLDTEKRPVFIGNKEYWNANEAIEKISPLLNAYCSPPNPKLNAHVAAAKALSRALKDLCNTDADPSHDETASHLETMRAIETFKVTHAYYNNNSVAAQVIADHSGEIVQADSHIKEEVYRALGYCQKILEENFNVHENFSGYPAGFIGAVNKLSTITSPSMLTHQIANIPAELMCAAIDLKASLWLCEFYSDWRSRKYNSNLFYGAQDTVTKAFKALEQEFLKISPEHAAIAAAANRLDTSILG